MEKFSFILFRLKDGKLKKDVLTFDLCYIYIQTTR